MNESENIITPEITPQYQRFTQQQTSIERGKLPPAKPQCRRSSTRRYAH